MSTLVKRAELTKLGALLDMPPHQLEYLEIQDISVLRQLRDQATDMLFEADRKRLTGAAAAAGIIPVAVSAKIVPHLIPPRLAARVSGLLDPAKAVELALRLPVRYLADLTPFLDPRRAQAILSKIPAKLVVEVAKLLNERADYITMGRMVSYLDCNAIALTIAALPDDALLHSGFMIEDAAQVAAILEMLPECRLVGMLWVAHVHGLWGEELSVLETVPDAVRGRAADLAAREGAEMLGEIVATTHREDAWDLLLSLSRSMSPESRAKLAAVVGSQPVDIIELIADAAVRHELTTDLEHLACAMPAEPAGVINRRLATVGA